MLKASLGEPSVHVEYSVEISPFLLKNKKVVKSKAMGAELVGTVI